MVQTGLISGENILHSDISSAQNIRKNFSSDVTFVFTILDTSHSEDHLDSTTQKVLEFYSWIFTYTQNNKDCGIIIQSKGISFGISFVMNFTPNGFKLSVPLSKLSTSISPQ